MDKDISNDASALASYPEESANLWPNENAALRWYVVQTQPHAEDRAITNLDRQAFCNYCPRIVRNIRHTRKVIQKRIALFPNYLFIRLDPTRDRWRSVNGTYGVVRLLTQGDTPLPVPVGIVEQLQARTNQSGLIDWAASFSPDQQVRISMGPFNDFVGRIEHLDSTGRVSVLLQMMGQAVTIKTSADRLSPIA